MQTKKRLNNVVNALKNHKNSENVAGMARFGINPINTLGVSMPVLRKLAKETGKDHALALELWETGIHEARILACLIAEPQKADEALLERWAADFDSWDVCDQCCSNFFDKTSFAWEKAFAWASRDAMFVKRAGYVMMAVLAVHDKKAADQAFIPFFPLIRQGAVDERNFVKKAVNWALRQIGKRSKGLHASAMRLAKELKTAESPAARWIGSDALRELEGETARRMLERRTKKPRS